MVSKHYAKDGKIFVIRPYIPQEQGLAETVSEGLQKSMQDMGLGITTYVDSALKRKADCVYSDRVLGKIEAYTLLVTSKPLYHSGLLQKEPTFGRARQSAKTAVVSTWEYPELEQGGIVCTALHEIGHNLDLEHHYGDCVMKQFELPTPQQQRDLIKNGKGLGGIMDVMAQQVAYRKPYYCPDCIEKIKKNI